MWIQGNIVIPDREDQGEPYILTDEQYRHLLWSYRLVPQAREGEGSDAFEYNGALLVRPQKWGKPQGPLRGISGYCTGPRPGPVRGLGRPGRARRHAVGDPAHPVRG